MPKIKCQSCTFQGNSEQDAQRTTLDELEFASSCEFHNKSFRVSTTRLTTMKIEKLQAKDEDKPKRRAAGKDRTPGGIPTLTWSAFISAIENWSPSGWAMFTGKLELGASNNLIHTHLHGIRRMPHIICIKVPSRQRAPKTHIEIDKKIIQNN